MAVTTEFPIRRATLRRETQLTWLTAVAALVASAAMLLTTSSAAVSPFAYWVVSSIALATTLAVLLAGHHAWTRMVATAEAAGVIGTR